VSNVEGGQLASNALFLLKNKHSNKNRITEAIWWSRIAYAKAFSKSFEESRKAALKALQLLGFTWPETSTGYAQQKFYAACRQLTLWGKTLGGSRRTLKTSADSRAREEILLNVLPALRESALHIMYLPKDEVELVALLYVNETIQLGDTKTADFTNACLYATHTFCKRCWQNKL
jgi:hypothetical protein